MKGHLKTTSSSPLGCFREGDRVLPDDLAKQLIDGGYATALDEPPAADPDEDDPDDEDLEDGEPDEEDLDDEDPDEDDPDDEDLDDGSEMTFEQFGLDERLAALLLENDLADVDALVDWIDEGGDLTTIRGIGKASQKTIEGLIVKAGLAEEG